jgi:CRISPR-associated protein Cas1
MIYTDLSGRLPFVYVEMGKLRVSGASLVFVSESSVIAIPVGRIAAVFLGPGISVTDRAVHLAATAGSMLLWVGEGITKCYAVLPTHHQSSKNLLSQIELLTKHKTKILKRYTLLRFGKKLLAWERLNENKIRGIEGSFMRKVYVECAKKFGIPYGGRSKEGSWENNSVYNKAISICNSYLYGMATAVLIALGYSPALGILHNGDSFSLSFDIADLYKHKFSIPLAFEASKKVLGSDNIRIEKEIRIMALEKMKGTNFVKAMVEDIQEIFDDGIHHEKNINEDEATSVSL